VIEPVSYGEVRFFRLARTIGGRGFYWTGVYFVDGLLIDSGPPNMRAEAARLFQELGVRACVTTHHHEDHSGNNALLTEHFGILPLAHAAGIARLAEPAPLHFYRKFAWGVPLPSTAEPVGEVVETEQLRFDVIHTPGHADDHVVLHERSRGWVFSGDLYLSSRVKVLRADEDVFALMDSLRRVIALEPQVLFCQHRGRLERPVALLQRKLDSLRALEDTIERLHAGGLSDDEIARALPGRDLIWRIGTRGHFSKANFVRAFLKRSPRSAD
jgi:glyoxylase-like metal-dependent hydrolase (beta-lactamase superfamily II)